MNKDKPEAEGGFQIDRRWTNDQESADRLKFLKNLQLSSFEPLEKMVNRVECKKCKKSCKFYCCNCIESVVENTPFIHLPVKVTVISHPKEKVSKSSILPAKIVAPLSVEILSTTEVPKFTEAQDEIVLLFPGDEAVQMTDLSMAELQKIKRVVLIDSTWSQTRHYMKDPNI